MEQTFLNLDAGESAIFLRDLESIKAKTYDKLYPEYKAQRLFPVDTSAGPGAETITYRSFDRVGVMKIIADYADDLPRSDVKGIEKSIIVKSLGGSFGYNYQEVKASAMGNRPLPQMKANAARQSWEAKVDSLAWYGDASANLKGILNQPDVPAATVQTGISSGNVTWLGAAPKTADEILKDMNDSIGDVHILTNEVEQPDTILLPTAHYEHIATTARSSTSDLTILEYFKRNRPGVTVESASKLAAVDPLPSGAGGPKNVMIAYKRDIDKLSLELPQLFEMLPVQERGLEYLVPTHARIGGLLVYYPLSINIVEGI